MEKNSTMMKQMNALEVIEMIVEQTNDQGITTEIKRGKQQLVTPAKPYIKELMARLGIENEMEALFLAVFVDQCNDTRINMKDIARHFDVRMVKILSMAERIDDLTPLEFYDHLDRLLGRRENDEIEDSELYQCIGELIDSNPQIELTSRLRSFGLNNSSLKLYLVLCRIFINNHDDRICRSDIRDYFDNPQEMEQLDGIMIATTNLTGSLDSAFERRFLYKIEFEKPTPNESRHIWKAMLPELTDDEALSLAKSYDFSGGQIENIARKQLIDNVLSESDSMNIEAIHEACKSESLSKHTAKRIGF